ncbi:Crp/Fnr family transcriptional regulator [Lewinella sp. JB7]|uniref:Crp/Fnr family transcriptional regulator n=1 Tax=Lewinella sp. JB7 TaxID=2962887 RepID=UPI0020C98377|nr:Crp/Fnr family transcriptional regulator [Lewinella sp. JB7]MCP9236681.1 Crp/Fnr family transcriptional regulator [Lewinella sp. JB7]
MPATHLTTDEVQQYFPQFSEPELQHAIADEGNLYRFAEGDMMMDYGGYIRMLPLIISGTIKISRLADDGSELFLYYLTRGESCTMTFSCCMSDKRSEIRAVAEEETTILALPTRKLDEWLMRFKSWKNFVMQSYDRRMGELITTIDQVTFHQLDQRLLDYLGRRAAVAEDRTIRTTHQTIADDLNVSREAVSRLLKAFERRGTIRLGRNSITIDAGK